MTRYSAASKIRTGRVTAGITITPLRGFFVTLLLLGVPTVSLGTICLSLIQNNLRLSEKNDELKAMASEVKAEVDSLGEEIDSLRERAGVPKESVTTEASSSSNVDAATNPRSSSEKSWSESITRTSKASSEDSGAEDLLPKVSEGEDAGEAEGLGRLTNALPPRGGPSKAIDPVDLLKDVQRQVPKLNRTLDSSVKPALEEALAEEAAYPDGQPVVGVVEVSSEFGIRSNPFGGGGYEVHEGIDFVGEHGDIIAATGDGTIKLAGPNGGYGLTVTIDHSYGYETLYAHMSEVKVKVGDTVKRGQIIGYIGSTGRSSGPHLHYSLYKNKKAINPRTLLKLPDNNLAQGSR
ncbi:MAG: M23 family metallopeptidase [Cyanobacteria bacterium J06626_6]